MYEFQISRSKERLLLSTEFPLFSPAELPQKEEAITIYSKAEIKYTSTMTDSVSQLPQTIPRGTLGSCV